VIRGSPLLDNMEKLLGVTAHVAELTCSENGQQRNQKSVHEQLDCGISGCNLLVTLVSARSHSNLVRL
jgi:hypothetical protein